MIAHAEWCPHKDEPADVQPGGYCSTCTGVDRMGLIRHPRDDDPEFHRAWADHWRDRTFEWARRAGEMEEERNAAREQLRGAVEALREIYDWNHMAGDGQAGRVSGEALRALGIDPDAGGQS